MLSLKVAAMRVSCPCYLTFLELVTEDGAKIV